MLRTLITTLVVLALGLLSFSVPTYGLTREDVLEIIRQNPEVIIETVEKYYLEKALAQESALGQQKQETLTQLFPDGQQVVLLEFGDYQCPFCHRVQPTVEQFLEQHPEIQFTYKHFPLDFHPLAIPASRLAISATPDQFPAVHQALYQTDLQDSTLDEIQQRFHITIDESKVQQTLAEDQQLAEKLAVDSTPHFFLFNPKSKQYAEIKGALPLDEFNYKLQLISSIDTPS